MPLTSTILENIAVHCDVDMPAEETEIPQMLQAACKSKLVATNAWEEIQDNKTRDYLQSTAALVAQKRRLLMPPDLKITTEKQEHREENRSHEIQTQEAPTPGRKRRKKLVLPDPSLLDEEIDHHPQFGSESLSSLLSLWDQEIIVIPYFQREFCWKVSEQEYFLQSWMRGVPIPPLFFATDPAEEENTLDVIDGVQRLNTFRAFRDGYIRYKGYTFTQLPEKHRNRFLTKSISTIKVSTPRDNWSEIFRDVNINGAPLNSMEMRRSVFIRSQFLNMLYTVSRKHKVWLDLYGNSKRARGLEQLVRSCAMHLMYKSYDKGIEKFLDKFCAMTVQEESEFANTKFVADTQRHLDSVLNAMVALGTQKAFKVGERKNINKGLVDCLMHAGLMISKLNNDKITTDKLGLLLQNVRTELLKDPHMVLCMTLHSNTIDSVRYRLEQTEGLVEDALLGTD